MNRVFIAKYHYFFKRLLIAGIVIGCVTSFISIISPILMFAGLKFVDGASDPDTIGNNILQMLIGILYVMPFAPYLLIGGSVSAVSYAALFSDNDSKFVLRIWALIMLAISLYLLAPYFISLLP